MKLRLFFPLIASVAAATLGHAQPAYDAPAPTGAVVEDAGQRRAEYIQRIDEAIDWRIGRVDFTQPVPKMDMATMVMLLNRGEHIDACNKRTLEMMEDPGSGPFWMFPCVALAYAGRDRLSSEAQLAIREAWRTTRQIRGDTENHWAMYYISLYLMSELYPNEPGSMWYNGKSSEENLAECRSYLIDWMNLSTTVGQGEFDPMQYIGEYAMPLLYLSIWAKDPEMRQRGHMMLDWLFAQLANNSLDGVLRGPNSRADEGSVIERWKGMTSYFCWLLFNNTPPSKEYGGWPTYFVAEAKNYDLPEVIYRLAVDRKADYLQRDTARVRRRWRYSDELSPPVYKTNYIRRDYAVGSTCGGQLDPIQAHSWDVTWAEPDPRDKHPVMFSMHPLSSGRAMQMYFTAYPEPWIKGVTFEGKPSYDSPDKVLGSSPYEQVFQDLDTVIALYKIPEGTRFPHINGFFSKDLKNVTEDESGWIFAQGGRAYLAYRPLAAYHWIPYLHYRSGWSKKPEALGGRLLTSPHLQNGTIVQAADEDEFESFEAFKAAMRALPLEFKLDPVPTVEMTTLRGKHLVFTYDQTPVVDGQAVDYSKWKLFEGPHLNAELGSRKLTITHGALQRVLDFNTLTIADTVTEP